MSISFELSSKSLDFSEFLFTNHTTWQRQILGAGGPVMAKIYILEERTEVITQLPQISSEGKKRIRKGGGCFPAAIIDMMLIYLWSLKDLWVHV